jgi:excisionase family DNA binding protein
MGMQLLSTKQLAKELGLPLRTVRALMWKRAIPHLRLGYRSHYFDVAKVKAALEKKFEVRAVGQ